MKKLLFDARGVLWKSLLAGVDKDDGYKVLHPSNPEKMVNINSAGFGFENFINLYVAALRKFDVAPKDTIFVLEGANAKLLRLQVSSDYKAGRDSDRPIEAYEEFVKLQDQAIATLKGLGACVVHQNGMEADDVIAYLARTLQREVVIVSSDGDMLALMNERVSVWTGDELNKQKYGPFPPEYVTLYKALVGDDSDNIKGASGFGYKTFLKMYGTFGDGGLEEMERLILAKDLGRLVEDVADFKPLQKIMDSAEQVYKSYDLARFYDSNVNRMRTPLVIEPGMVEQWDSSKHDARLKQWYGAARIVHQDNYEEACRWGLGKLLESSEVFLDIETSSTEESDAWMREKNREADEDTDLGVDVLGHRLTSLGLTFGSNNQYTLYFTVDHVEEVGCKNLTSAQVRQFIEMVPHSKPIVIQNVNFELPVLFLEWGDVWKDNPEHGFLVNVLDTKLMASYVDENQRAGLKERSKAHLGYEQGTYKDLLQRYEVKKMNQLTAAQAFDYGSDDTICTAALYNYYRLVMEIEHTWEVFKQVEVDAAYLVAHAFIRGIPISLEHMFELEREDDAAYERAWASVRDYLISKGWEGTAPPVYDTTITPAQVKEAFQIVTGSELVTQVRKIDKLAALIETAGQAELSVLVANVPRGAEDAAALTDYVRVHFKGEPQINFNSPLQVRKLLYEVMGLEVRLRNPLTDTARAEGVSEGSPSTDALAIQYALIHDTGKGPEVASVLKALQALQIVATRRKLYYKPYRHVQHWLDGRVHPQIKQCATNTRRFAAADPNVTQLPKHPKATGEPARFREIYTPHKPGAVVYPPDFNGQELRLIAEMSQDENMLACYVGANKKNMHALTATGIANRIGANPKGGERWLSFLQQGAQVSDLRELAQFSYDDMVFAKKSETHSFHTLVDKGLYPLGKKTNFTTEYGAQKKKLARTLICTEAEAQEYIDAKLEQFPGAEAWKKRVVEEMHKTGYTTTMMGARRHLASKLLSGKGFEIGKAERQGVNFKVQGSGAEMTKLAMGRIWRSGILFRYDAVFYMPPHDELVFSVTAEHAVPFIKESNQLMTMPYATMRVPIIASISVGPNYGQQQECGDEFDEGEVLKQVAIAAGVGEEELLLAMEVSA